MFERFHQAGFPALSDFLTITYDSAVDQGESFSTQVQCM